MMKHYAKRIGSLIVCLVLVILSLAGCTSATNQNAIPLIFKYETGNQVSYVKALWSPQKGTVEVSKEPVLSYSASSSIVGIRWDSSQRVTVFNRENTSHTPEIKSNGVSVSIISLVNPLPLWSDPVSMIYTKDQTVFVRQLGNDTTIISEITPTSVQQFTLHGGTFLSLGIAHEKTLALIAKPPQIANTVGSTTLTLAVEVLNKDGTVIEEPVHNSLREDLSYFSGLCVSCLPAWENGASFVNGNFYLLGKYKVNADSKTYTLEETPTIFDSLSLIAKTPTFSYENSDMIALLPMYSTYRDYLIVTGQTFSSSVFTIAAFKDDQLTGFALVNLYPNWPADINTATTSFTTYDATGKQLNTYSIQTPLQVVVPQS